MAMGRSKYFDYERDCEPWEHLQQINLMIDGASLVAGPTLRVCLDAVPMTKAETIMRREEALMMVWPLIKIIPGAIVPQDPCPVVEDCDVRRRYAGVLFGESANEIQRLRSLLRMVGANLHNPILGGISNDQLSAIDEAIGRDNHAALCHHAGWYETYNGAECPNCGKSW